MIDKEARRFDLPGTWVVDINQDGVFLPYFDEDSKVPGVKWKTSKWVSVACETYAEVERVRDGALLARAVLHNLLRD